MEPFEMKTHGFNYWPMTNDQHISSAHLGMDITAEVQGQEVNMQPDQWICGSGCRAVAVPERVGEDGSAVRDVSIIRFAKFGRSKIPSGEEFDWLVALEEGRELKGSLTTERQGIDGSGFLVLSMGMQLTIQFDGQPEPVKLKSRKTPRLEGPVDGWPPYNAPLTLVNGPIPYFLESDMDNQSAAPLVTVTANEATIGAESYPLLSNAPELTRAEATNDGTANLAWNDTAAEVRSKPPITSYRIYRNDTPGDPDGWSMITSLPATKTEYIDGEFPGGEGAEYLVLHAAELIFGYELECMLGTPQLVRPLTKRP